MVSQDIRRKTQENMNAEEVATLIRMQVIEKEALRSNQISPEDSLSLTIEASKQVGEKSSLKTFFLSRAKLLNRLLPKSDPHLIQSYAWIKTWPLTFVSIVLSLLLGVLIGQITSGSSRINLLSPPFLGLIVWNLIVYLLILINLSLRLLKKNINLPFRTRITSWIVKFQRKSHKGPIEEAFWNAFLPLCTPIIRQYSSFLLHVSALCLGLGVVLGLAFHGFATSITVGWESTWFFNQPEMVQYILNTVYGWLPLVNQEITLQSVQQMHFDVNYSGIYAGPWLLRLMMMVSLLVIIPRGFLALFSLWKQKQATNHFDFYFNQPYFQNIIRQRDGKTMKIHLIPFATTISVEEHLQLEKLTASLELGKTQFVDHPTFYEDTDLPKLDGQSECWVVFSMGATGEEDVQGQFIRDLIKLCSREKNIIRIFVNSASFEERFKKIPLRIEQRKHAWNEFLATYQQPFAIVNLKNMSAEDIK